jgi:hypothetical protein
MLASATGASAGSVVTAVSAEYDQAQTKELLERAEQLAADVEEQLLIDGTATFTDAAGQTVQIVITDEDFLVDGEAVSFADEVNDVSASASSKKKVSWWCKTKIAAAAAAILGVGAAFIAWMITGLSIGAIVSIAGLKLSAGTWSSIALVMGSKAALLGLLQTVLC